MLCNVVKNLHRLWWMPTGLLRLIPKPLEREVLAGFMLPACVVIKIRDDEAGFGCDICELGIYPFLHESKQRPTRLITFPLRSLISKPLEREVLAWLVLAVCVVIKVGDNEAGFGCDICELTRVFA